MPTSGPLICQLDHRGLDRRTGLRRSGRPVGHAVEVGGQRQPGGAGTGPGRADGDLRPEPQRRRAPAPRAPGASILGPSEPWEGTIVEAPDMVAAWGTYWLIFSGNWYDSPAYGIGVAACQSPLGPCADTGPGSPARLQPAGRGTGRGVAVRGRLRGLPPLQPLPGQRPRTGHPAAGGDGPSRVHSQGRVNPPHPDRRTTPGHAGPARSTVVAGNPTRVRRGRDGGTS